MAETPDTTYVITCKLEGESFELDLTKLTIGEVMWFEAKAGMKWIDVLGNALQLVTSTPALAAIVSIAGAKATNLSPTVVWDKVEAAGYGKVDLILPNFKVDDDGEDEVDVPPTSQRPAPKRKPARSGGGKAAQSS